MTKLDGAVPNLQEQLDQLSLTSCDFVSDSGCSDLTCPQCHSLKEACEPPARGIPARKEWDAERYDRGDTSEIEGYESADYVDGWNVALDAVEQQTAVTERPEAADSASHDKGSKVRKAHAVRGLKHVALICTLIGCLIAACVGVILILLGAPGIAVALSTYAAGVGGGWLVTLRMVRGLG